MRLEKDVMAPIFQAKDIYGRTIDLASYKDKKVFIGFFRHAGCPFCNLRVHALTQLYGELKAKAMEMIFFFESKESILLQSNFHRAISPIPSIADPAKRWYDAYGLECSGYKSAISHLTSFVQTAYKASSLRLPVHLMAGGESIKTMPAEFLVDRGLIIKEVYYSERLHERMNIANVLAFAEQ